MSTSPGRMNPKTGRHEWRDGGSRYSVNKNGEMYKSIKRGNKSTWEQIGSDYAGGHTLIAELIVALFVCTQEIYRLSTLAGELEQEIRDC